MPIEIYKETRVAQQDRQLANAIASTRGMNDEFYTITVFLFSFACVKIELTAVSIYRILKAYPDGCVCAVVGYAKYKRQGKIVYEREEGQKAVRFRQLVEGTMSDARRGRISRMRTLHKEHSVYVNRQDGNGWYVSPALAGAFSCQASI